MSAEKIKGIDWRTLRIAQYEHDRHQSNSLVVDHADAKGKRHVVVLVTLNPHVEGWEDVRDAMLASYRRKHQPQQQAA